MKSKQLKTSKQLKADIKTAKSISKLSKTMPEVLKTAKSNIRTIKSNVKTAESCQNPRNQQNPQKIAEMLNLP